MRNRKIVIGAFLLIAVMCISMGYASVSDLLDIQGASNVDAGNVNTAFDENIFFSDAKVGVPANEGKDTATVSATNDKATFSANCLTVKGDTAIFVFTIQNNNDYAAKVTPRLSQNTNETTFKITSDWNNSAQTIDAKSSKDYTITIELLESVTTSVGASYAIELAASEA